MLALELSTEPPGCKRADGGWREEGRRDRDGGSEARKDGGSEIERTKVERKEGRCEAGRRKEERVRPSNGAEEE